MLEFVFWDVQHGSACYVKTPNGRHMVIDLGTGSYQEHKPFSPLLHLKNKYGVTRLDYVVITHPHRDHIDDIFNFDALDPKTLYRPRHLTENDVLGGNKKEDVEKVRAYLAIDKRYNAPVEAGSSSDGSAPSQWGNVKISFFTSPGCNTGNLNNHSVVTVFEYATSKIIVPGDNEEESWKELIKDKGFIAAAKDYDVLLASHHGRKAGYSPELFEAIGKPRLTVISDGPYCETSATALYGNQSRGWTVHYPDNTSETRLCVTTRQDGVIRVQAYYGTDNKAYLVAKVQRGTASKVVGARR